MVSTIDDSESEYQSEFLLIPNSLPSPITGSKRFFTKINVYHRSISNIIPGYYTIKEGFSLCFPLMYASHLYLTRVTIEGVTNCQKLICWSETYMSTVSGGRPRPFVLIIMDGWGINPRKEGNAIALARTPNIYKLA